MGHLEAVHSYYDALDDGDYDALLVLLDPEFEQTRPDRSFTSRRAFIDFMQEDRPHEDTSHEIDVVYRDDDGDRTADDPAELAVRGRLCTNGGAELTGFVDVFQFEDGRIAELRTYTD
jgi:ketosteroid isomerase-like protein